jgi:mRNA interferase HigB
MHVISRKAINDFVLQHPTAKASLNSWFKIVSKTNFSNFNELRVIFPSADVVKNVNSNNLTIFNIHGNEVRLIANIHYNRNKLYIRDILTHSEYDKEKWKNK